MIQNKRILITGGNSMVGSHIADLLKANNEVDTCPHSEISLLDLKQVQYRFDRFKPDLVIHAATYSGNIQFNTKYPYDTFWRTTQMGLNVLECCEVFNVEKVLSILSSCTYPDIDNVEINEDDLWRGLPHKSIASHGLAKRNLQALSRFAREQYSLNAICCVLSNSFGPRDSFSVDKTKVVGGMIKKLVDAKENKTVPEFWGTGTPRRELIYAEDAAKLIVRCLEVYNSEKVINIGTPHEVSIRELAATIAAAVGYTGETQWLTRYPDGQMRKKLDLTIMNKLLLPDFDFEYTKFDVAIKETVEWYLKNRNNLR